MVNTKTNLFSAVDNDAVDKEPNSCVSPIDYALPGMLPVLNKAAVEKAVGEIKGVTAAEVNLGAKTVTVTGTATADEVQKAVEKAGFEFKGENK